ncbi:MAG TPA: patatin-like phospholipase family protein [Aquihabitans sp.]|jgi:NTE family protein|nr:patatin-like phospholipase family protein [Aquihabitans sp.]
MAAPTRALVLGGGGLTGIAWTTGLLHGLAQQGVELTDADLVVGTSAGSAVGAQVRLGRPLGELHQAQLDPTTTELAAELDLDALAAIFGVIIEAEPHDTAACAQVGAMALTAETVPEPVRRAVIEARLGTETWPAGGALRITAVDAGTGELVVFDGSQGVGLIDAVAASCAVPGVWPPVTIGDRRYVDGGVRSVANADLATGHDVVVVVLPLAGLAQHALDVELDGLRREGSTVCVLSADDAATEAMGPNPLDPRRRPPAAEAGHRQASDLAEQLRTLWS